MKTPEEWEFLSYLDYVGLRQGTLPKVDDVLERAGSVEAYRGFVEAAGVVEPELQRLMLD